MAIKNVFGFFQGNKSKFVDLVETVNGVGIYKIRDEDDHGDLCIERDGMLYRITLTRNLDGLRSAIAEGSLCSSINSVIDKCAPLIGSDKKIFANVNLYGFANRMQDYINILNHNKALDEKKSEEAARKAELARIREEEEQARADSENTEKVISGSMVDCDQFVRLCDLHNIQIPIRTRGWLLERGIEIGPDNVRFIPKRRGQKASQKAFEIYSELRSVLSE